MRDLTINEARVLGCLMEKERTTPDAYPLTVNSLRNASNQSTSRDPVMSLTDLDIEKALASLRELGLTRTVHSTSNRATKFRHVLPEVLELDDAEAALITVLMLRGEQTIGELKSRTERLHAFESTDEVSVTLAALAGREQPLTRQLDRKPGQKDARWVQLLTGAPSAGTGDDSAAELAEDLVDPYGQATAEFYDLLATAHWETFGLQLFDLLEGVDPAAGPIVDVGSGTGVGLPYLVAAVDGATVHAVEPSRAMRTALHTRLMLDPSLREAVTVDPRPFATAALPPKACAIVVSAVLGHLDDSERAQLWGYVATALPPGAPAVIEVLPPERPVSVPRTRYRSLPVGSYVYEGWQSGEPADTTHMLWTMEYVVTDGATNIASDRVESRWRCFGVADIEAEVRPLGLRVRAFDDCVVVSSPEISPA